MKKSAGANKVYNSWHSELDILKTNRRVKALVSTHLLVLHIKLYTKVVGKFVNNRNVLHKKPMISWTNTLFLIYLKYLGSNSIDLLLWIIQTTPFESGLFHT